MFDIGFLEIFVVLIIALLVIGPQRMPEVARKLGSFMGKTRNFINQMKQDSPLNETVREVKDAMNFEEEKRQMTNMTQELEESLNFKDTEVSLEDFQRPFGGDATDSSSSQFNKAPSQPKRPEEPQTTQTNESATVAAQPPEEKNKPTQSTPDSGSAAKTSTETQKS